MQNTLFGQILHSWDGAGINPNSKFRVLTIFINVIYDTNQNYYDSVKPTQFWGQASIEGVNNEAIPSYLLDFIDTTYNCGNLHGSMTRLYGESSFDSLQITGDFVVVNVKESSVLLNYNYFNYYTIGNTAIDIINQNGLQTLYHHDSIYDYDLLNNDTIFYIQFLIRNITSNYGGLSPGEGYGNQTVTKKIRIGNQLYSYRKSSMQCCGSGNIANEIGNVVYHELSHSLFGTNAFHTSGGNHYGSQEYMPFLTIQEGYGLMGQAGKSLSSCNGYERWRMHWKHPNAPDYITARNMDNTTYQISDIRKEDGNKSFLLRDFVTYGDAIRIKLPYKDSEDASNQYIWLENHKVGLNNKLDFFQYSNISDCRPQGKAGIYAYYQIGRDILSGAKYEVWFIHERDNLKIIPAEGYWNYSISIDTNNPYNMQCINWDDHTYYHYREEANPFCGYQDQEVQYHPMITDNMLALSQAYPMWRKKIGNNIIDSLAILGDNRDAFSVYSKINMGTNPSTCNAKTYYNYIYKSGTYDFTSQVNRNNQTTYLTGLSIEMIPQANNDFIVHIRWDDYDIVNDANWTGKIVLKEKANLTNGNNILLTQNLTLAEPFRNTESGVFAPTTTLTCENGSVFTLEPQSSVSLEQKSKIVLQSGSTFIISDLAEVVVGANCTFEIEPCATLIIQSSGKLIIDDSAIFTVHPDAIIQIDEINNILLPINANFSTENGLPFTSVVELLNVLGIAIDYSINHNILMCGQNVLLTKVLTIESGAELTIQNTVRCLKDVSIVIKPGGKLIVDGGTLTSNTCNGELWQGIEVQGNPLLSQDLNNTNQGILILQNEAIIENAECGVYVGKKDTILISINGGTIVPIPEGFEIPVIMSSGGGGIVSATNSSFINNKKAIDFQSYTYTNLLNNEIDNKSSFTNCSFIVNDNALFIVVNNQSQVSLRHVKGVRFNGCNFIDAQPKSSLDNYGIGIYSYNAGICLNDNRSLFNLIPYEATPCSFSGYGTAIQIKYSGTRPTRIYNTSFINNQTSINAVSAYALTMQMCDVHNTLYNHHFPSLYGLILNKCDNYSVENNIFYGNGTGILFLGEETNNNYIKNNTFHDMCVACYVDGVQGCDDDNIPHTGLKFLCNFFNNNDADIVISENNRICPRQGYFSNSWKYLGTGNKFGPTMSLMNINNLGSNFIGYYYDNSDVNQNPLYYYNYPTTFDKQGVNGNKCISSGYIGENYYYYYVYRIPLTELNDNFISLQNQYIGILNEYNNLYGDIPIRDVINQYGLPTTSGIVPQFDMYAELTDLKDSLTIICQNALQLLLTSEELDKSEYNTWLYRCETIDADYVLAESYLNEENIAQMNTILDDIPNKYPNCDLVEVAQYKICLNYSYQWENANTDSLIITQESIDSLELIASGSNRASLKAEAMLEKLGKDIIPRWEQDRCNWWVIASTPLENKNETFIKETKIGPKQEMILTPNPATDKLKVDNGQIHIKELYIYDVVGKEVKRFKGNNTKITVSVDDLCSGVYIVKALSENGIAIKKFVKK